MSRKDNLSTLLFSGYLHAEEWTALGKVLGISGILDLSDNARSLTVNKELRHYFGHTVANFFRDEYEPDYREPILNDVAEYLGIEVQADQSDMVLEEKVLQKILLDYKKKVIKDKGLSEWEEVERDTSKYYEILIQASQAEMSVTKEIGKKVVTSVIMLNPVGRLLVPVYEMGDTNWKKVLSAVGLVCAIRKRIEFLYGEESIYASENSCL